MRRLIPAIALVALACHDESRPKASAHLPRDSGVAVAPEIAEPTVPARVTLTEAAVRTAGVTVAIARAATAGTVAGWLTVPGQIEADPERVMLISPRVSGRLERLDAVVGERVQAGQVVAQLSSAAFVTAQTDFQLALRRAQYLAGTADSSGASALAAAARRRLATAGATDEEIARLAGGAEPVTLLAIRAPRSGSLVEQGALAGAAVEAGTMLFRLVDLTEVDVVAEVPERELPRLRIGQRATVTLPAYPGQQFKGVVERIRDELDATTRTVDAVLHVPNPGSRLRPGMFATVQLGVVVGGAGLPAGVSVPEAAVLMDGSERIVFVELEPGTYERRVVSVTPLGSPDGTPANERRLMVTGGLQAGERVVVAGAFTLKSELAKAAFAEDE